MFAWIMSFFKRNWQPVGNPQLVHFDFPELGATQVFQSKDGRQETRIVRS